MTKLSAESKFFIGIILATLAIIGVAITLLSKPLPVITIPKETLITPDSHTKGNKDAAVYLVEFSDFQCPSCRIFSPTVKKLTDQYKDSLFFAYRHLPLTQHEYAIPAAKAAEAAGLQGKFWEAEAMLFENQEKFSDTYWEELAHNLDLNIEQFNTDLQSKKIASIIELDSNTAALLKLPGTPTFFLNGVMLKNLTSTEDLVVAVENALKAQQ